MYNTLPTRKPTPAEQKYLRHLLKRLCRQYYGVSYSSSFQCPASVCFIKVKGLHLHSYPEFHQRLNDLAQESDLNLVASEKMEAGENTYLFKMTAFGYDPDETQPR